jgi:hypothetical protein
MRRDDDPVHVRVTHEGAEPVGDTVEGEPLEDGAVRETDRARPVGPITKSGLSRTLGESGPSTRAESRGFQGILGRSVWE